MMNEQRHGWTLWLVIAAIGVHIIEEYALNFNGWAHRLGFPLTSEDFHLANAGVTVYAISCAVIGWRAPAIALSSPALVVLNAVGFHLGASLLTGSYSPGTATALLLFVPAGVTAYAGAARDGALDRRTLLLSIGLAIAWHAFLGGVFYVKLFTPPYA